MTVLDTLQLIVIQPRFAAGSVKAKALDHSSQKCDKLSDRKCLNSTQNGTCEYGMRCRFSHAGGVDEAHITDFDADEQELDAQQVQDMVNAGDLDFPCSDDIAIDTTVETEESHLTDDIEADDGECHATDFIEDDGSMWFWRGGDNSAT